MTLQGYSLIVLPFQLMATAFILRHFSRRVAPTTFALFAICLVLDLTALIFPSVFPLSSFTIIITVLRHYGKSWGAVGAAFIINAIMYGIYSKVPMGAFFVTAVNYYIAYNVMQCLTVNEVYIKNALYYAALKHLAVAAGHWFGEQAFFEFIADALSVIVSYYLVRASVYYYKHGKESMNAPKAEENR